MWSGIGRLCAGYFHSSGATLLAAIVVLSIMILPLIINVSETALRAVPREYEEASLALGATELETFFKVSLPAARSGVAAAVVLGVGRAIGEAMAIIMVSGNDDSASYYPYHTGELEDSSCCLS